MDQFNQIESHFSYIDCQISQLRNSYLAQFNQLEAKLGEFFNYQEEKIRDEIVECCSELRNRLKNSLEVALTRPGESKRVEFYDGEKKNMSFYKFFTSCLHHVNPFGSIEKIKYINFLRVFEYNEGNFGLDDLNGLNVDYDILNVVLISLNRVFLYLTCRVDIEKPDLMVIRHVNVGHVNGECVYFIEQFFDIKR